MSNVTDVIAENKEPINANNKNEDDLKQFKEDVMNELNYLDYSVSGIEVYERKCRFYFARKWFEFEIYDTEKVLKVYTMNQFQPIVSTLIVGESKQRRLPTLADFQHHLNGETYQDAEADELDYVKDILFTFEYAIASSLNIPYSTIAAAYA